MKRAHMTDDLIGDDQKIPDWVIEIMFLGDVEVAIRSGSKSSFSTTDFSISNTI